jgi:hypothetical protein
MAARTLSWLVPGIFLLVLVAGQAFASSAADLQCNGVQTGLTVRNVTVPADGSCTLRNSKVTGRVTASAGSYFQASHTQIAGDVVAIGAQTLFLDHGSAVRGSVRAGGVAQLFMFASHVRKNLRVDHASDQVFICGSTVERGSISVLRSTRNIVVGDPGAGACPGNTVRQGNMSVLWNTTDVQLVISGNRFPKGNLIVAGNGGTSPKTVRRNSGGRHIACASNAPQFRASENRRWKSGVCKLS